MEHLWRQEEAQGQGIVYRKINRKLNPAGAISRHLAEGRVREFAETLSQVLRDGLPVESLAAGQAHHRCADSGDCGKVAWWGGGAVKDM